MAVGNVNSLSSGEDRMAPVFADLLRVDDAMAVAADKSGGKFTASQLRAHVSVASEKDTPYLRLKRSINRNAES